MWSWLILALPGVLGSGAWLGQRALGPGRSARALAAPLALGAWVIAMCAAGRVTGSFWRGLTLGTLAVSLLGTAGWIALRPDLRRWRRPNLHAWALAALFIALLYPAARKFFHDELPIAGHLSTVGALLRGPFPPRFPIFPEFELRYHYGFDVVAAAVAAMFRLSPADAIDVTTLAGAGLLALLLHRVGELLVGPRAATCVALLGVLGGGVPFFALARWPNLGERLTGRARVGDVWINPPVTSYVFQHPFALGLPLAAALLVLVLSRGRARTARYGAYALLLAAASICHLAVFAAVGTSVLAVEALARNGWRPSARRVLGAALAGGLALMVARGLGGFFAPAPYLVARTLEVHLGVTGKPGTSLSWLAQTLGALLPLGLLGLVLLRRRGLALALLALGSLTVTCTLRYTHSWDIVKFCTLGQLALGVGAGAAVVDLVRRGLRTRGARRALWLGVATLGGGTAVSGGVAFPAAIALAVEGATYGLGPNSIDADDAAVIAFLSDRVGPREIVYRSEAVSESYAQRAGLPTAWPVWPTDAFGFEPSRIAARRQLLKELPRDPARWRSEGIRWFVVDRDEKRPRALVEEWAREGTAVEVARFGRRAVVHLGD